MNSKSRLKQIKRKEANENERRRIRKSELLEYKLFQIETKLISYIKKTLMKY